MLPGVITFVIAIAAGSAVAQEPNGLVTRWLQKETSAFERAELSRKNEVSSVSRSIAFKPRETGSCPLKI